jgi:hypothetical protein
MRAVYNLRLQDNFEPIASQKAKNNQKTVFQSLFCCDSGTIEPVISFFK